MWQNNWWQPPQAMQNQGWFQDWLQGIVSRAATQQGFFAAIYEPVLVPTALVNDSNTNTSNDSSVAKPKTEADQPSGLRGSAVIGNNSKNQNNADRSGASKDNDKKQDEEIMYSEEESDRVYVWGYFNFQSYYRPEVYKGLQGRAIVQVACGVDHTVFLTDLGKVYCSGQNTHYQLGDGTMMDHDNPTQVTKIDHLNIIKISCGSSFTLALTDTGNVIMWGTLRHGDKFGTVVLQEPAYVKPLKRVNIVDIASGGAHVLALGSDGTLYTWGNPMFGRLGRKTELGSDLDPRLPSPVMSLQGIRVSQIDCGEQHSILLTNTGKVYTWGRNDYKECSLVGQTEIQLPTPVEGLETFTKSDEIQQVRAGFRFSMCRTAQKVFSWGAAFRPRTNANSGSAIYPLDGFGPTEITYDDALPRDFRIADLVTGTQHGLIQSERGQLFSFGLSTNGQTGQNSPEYVPKISEVPMDKRIDKIAAGGKTSIAIHGSVRSVLGENMQKIINSEKMFGDVLLKPNGGQPMYAHKAVLAARSSELKEMIIKAEKSSNGSVPVLDFSQYNPKQLYAILIYIYTYRLLSSSISADDLANFVKTFKIKEPAAVRTPPPLILAADLSELLVWQTYKSNEDDAPLIKLNLTDNAGRWADIKFMVQGKEIVAHKAILCANSEYFRVMLTGGMKESQMEVIEVQDDITFEAFAATLQFLYTDNVEVDVNYALDILPVASLYNLQRLKVRSK
eukprot:TRINITY_DN4359_c0_g1_i1.p1 TRINITY_DN4359_c0_g1~~TRINITY_DN4359_c0_g1_i1.p1  ORF type:complete len:731 (-),score=131.48 TRINITY_DN4359_c0_g1_i1:347-2539(-)